MKKIASFITLIALLLSASVTHAQKYITDDNLSDSISVYYISSERGEKTEYASPKAFNLPLGDTIFVERTLIDNSSYAVFTLNGKKYAISVGDILFCDNNPIDVDDPFDTRSAKKHSWASKYFGSMTPYLIIAALFVLAMGFMLLGFKSDAFRIPALIIVPICILLASLFEIWAYWVLGSNAFWWCDYDRYGFWGSLLRVLPFIIFVAFQLFSIKLYMTLITDDDDNDLSVKPMLISIGISVPVFLVTAIIFAGLLHMDSPWAEIITIASFFITLLIGIFISFKRNIEELGKLKGLMFSLFGIVWSTGAVVAIFGLLVVLFKLIIQVVAILLAFIILPLVFTRRYRDADGNIYEEI